MESEPATVCLEELLTAQIYPSVPHECILWGKPEALNMALALSPKRRLNSVLACWFGTYIYIGTCVSSTCFVRVNGIGCHMQVVCK
jgi:hypothetical protein